MPDFKIRYIVDDSQPKAAYRGAVRDLASVEAQAAKTAVAVERVFRAAGSGAAQAAEAVKAAGAGFAAAGEAARKASGDFGKAAEAAGSFVRSTERAAAVMPALVAPVARLAIESARFGDAMGQKALPGVTRSLVRTRIEAVGLGGDLARAGGRGGTELAKLAPVMTRFQQETVTATVATDKLAGSTEAVSGSMGGFLGKVLAISAARAGFSAILEESQRLEEFWHKLASEATDFRDSLRELASLRGQPGPGEEVTAPVLEMALRTGTTAAKAGAAMAAYENIGPAVRAKGHYQPTAGTPEQLESDVVSEALRTGRRLGVPESVAAEGVGTAGLFHKFTSKEQAMQQFAGGLKGISQGKMPYGKGLSALNKAAAKLVDTDEAAAEGAGAGKVRSFEEAGVYLGALSLGTGTAEQAGHRMVQTSRVLNPDASNAKGIKALKDAGVTAEMSDPEKLIQLGKYIKAKGIKSPRDWMQQNNLGTVATREGMEAALKQTDVLEKWLNEARTKAATNAAGQEAVAANAAFFATDKAAAASQIASAQDVQNKATAISGPETFEQAKAAAELRMQQNDPGYFGLARGVVGGALGLIPGLMSGVGPTGYRQENDAINGAIPTLRRRAREVGIDLDREFPGINSNDYLTRARAFEAASKSVKARGGSPVGLGSIGAGAQKAVDAIKPPMPAGPGPAAMNGPIPATGLMSALAMTALGATSGPGGEDESLATLRAMLVELRRLTGSGWPRSTPPQVTIKPAPVGPG